MLLAHTWITHTLIDELHKSFFKVEDKLIAIMKHAESILVQKRQGPDRKRLQGLIERLKPFKEFQGCRMSVKEFSKKYPRQCNFKKHFVQEPLSENLSEQLMIDSKNLQVDILLLQNCKDIGHSQPCNSPKDCLLGPQNCHCIICSKHVVTFSSWWKYISEKMVVLYKSTFPEKVLTKKKPKKAKRKHAIKEAPATPQLEVVREASDSEFEDELERFKAVMDKITDSATSSSLKLKAHIDEEWVLGLKDQLEKGKI